MNFETYFLNNQELPLVLEPKNKNITFDELKNLIVQNNDFFKSALLKHGGLLFRKCPIHNEHDFSSLIKALDNGNFLNYIGGDSPRNKIIDGVYTSTEAPPSVKILLHNELSFVNNHPKHIYFYCHIAPLEKGETIIADARKVYKDVNKEVKKRFIDKGLKYVSRYFHKSDFMRFMAQNAHKSWVDVFETEDKDLVEKLCKENDFEFQWTKNEWIEIRQTRPATINHPETQEPIWFNQAHLYDFNPKFLGWWRYLGTKLFYSRKHTKLHDISFADETPIDKKDMYHIIDVLEDNTIAFPWKKGDVLVLDNILTMHGRATFSGKRRILTAMTG